MYKYVRAKKLPYSLDEVRKMTATRKKCIEAKPHFYTPAEMHVIKATKPIERLIIDSRVLLVILTVIRICSL